ncbi:hypothetical protein EN829_011230 [Mesorhizobium sp. M00.F.Ca.ET.186.01.1.1]|nr:hypothetical protein EN848_06785 [bacterium M00.F.Ca.ET.205.01.1.1]TGU53772.1 hypothetical protein EN795_11205 [bacterium M00.F.Ca.ET.152.01.1.1]TGV37270.1 hypothetical protein EN829_011230 [Mesorhizobium sp. M00.F.Ca.ET.186.01.1.1]TGZ39359.1 hypothetical protein EN805_28785 [bacterium M00.F.Ca.ET.162.01.1.1]TIW61226.1 MAG: hypothetical protein E5V48_10080 [Mesorhizobium sp.]
MIRLVAALGLGVTAAALALANLALYDTPVDISPTKGSAQRSVREAPDAATGLPATADASGFAETFARPLFTPTRRKFVPVADGDPQAPVASDPVAPAQPVASAPPGAAPALLGVSINGAGARVLLQAAGADKASWYGSGETVDGWKVAGVEKDAATLERDGKSARVLLYPPVVQPPPPPGGGDGL